MGFKINKKQLIKTAFLLLSSISVVFMIAPRAQADVGHQNAANLGVIKGVVRDHGGNPIADASVAIFRAGTSKLLKQVTSGRDGSFWAKMIPGTYTVLAVAQGFNPVTLFSVQISPSADFIYGFKLERAGSGNTLPEKRVDRNSSRWRIRAAQTQRSIYQNQKGEAPVDESVAAVEDAVDSDERSAGAKGQTVVQTYVAGSKSGNYAGVNFATQVPVGENAGLVVSGQTAKGDNAPLRLGADVTMRANAEHQLRFNSSVGLLGVIGDPDTEKALGQFSFQALDEWKVREGIIFVFGIDYSRFLGAGDDSSIAPRLGLQFDLDSKTRFRSAFTTQTEQKSWANAIDLEGQSIAFTEPVSVEDLVIENGRPLMNRSRRLEFGVERILDEQSSVEANVFFDATLGRGVGLNSLAFDDLGENGIGDIVANQQGNARGVRVVYSRRLSGPFSAMAGYSFGNGQRLSAEAVSDPSSVFETGFFQSFFGQLAADLSTGTSVKTIYRLSPQATIFAIDPFKGSLAIYDPGLSVYVTQTLPTLGLPIRAQAIVDARNIFDFQSGVATDEGSIKLNAQRRVVRGGIQVRF